MSGTAAQDIKQTDTGRGEWAPPRESPAADAVAVAAWERATAEIRSVAARDGLSKAEVSRRANIPQGTFSPWYDGTYTGSYAAVTARAEKWLQSVEEARSKLASAVAGPGFIETKTSREVIDTLLYAQILPEMVIVTLGPGMGKTMSARHFVATRPNAHLVTMRPTTTSTHAMLQELALSLDVTERNPARLDRALGMKLRRNGRQTLLIIDEAQNLADVAVNQLRYFLDEYGCGIALLGNEEVFTRFGRAEPREGLGQLHRRIGKRLRRTHPLLEDIEALLDAWEIADPGIRRMLAAIGKKPGALGQIDKTLRLAGMLASGGGATLSIEHIRAAWMNRGGEELRAS
jgi:DNA transposition AAA+ family ATPase